MNKENLTNANYILFCATHYNNPHYSTEEFLEDIARIKYIKKLVTRYVESDDLRERLILNHIIVLNNCFGPEIVCKILYLKLQNQMEYVKPFLVYLNIFPDKLYNINDKLIIDTNTIGMDDEIVSRLRKLRCQTQ